MDPIDYIPPRFTLQWHITNRCNNRCAHCYQESYEDEKENSPDMLRSVLDQFKGMLLRWRKSMPLKAHINLTGGEPFLHPDFFALLEQFHEDRKIYTFAILSNGSTITDETAKRLASLHPLFVQVSIEGSQAVNDSIRSSGSFDKTVEAIRKLKLYKIPVLISFTASRRNSLEFPYVVSLARKLKVDRVWVDRMLPYGTGESMRAEVLDKTGAKEFFDSMYREKTRWIGRWFSQTEVCMNRALQFLCGGEHPYHCTAGDSLLAIMPNGDLYPCRRMPIYCGNVHQTPLERIYYESETLLSLRNRHNLDKRCQNCNFFRQCLGGLRCLSYAVEKNPFARDPACWL